MNILSSRLQLLDNFVYELQDRLKLARKRRVQQLKKWNQKEKEFMAKTRKSDSKGTSSSSSTSSAHIVSNAVSAVSRSFISSSSKKSSSSTTGLTSSNVSSKLKKSNINNNLSVKKVDYKVHFVPSVMLLEAAARNDIEEVRRLLMLSVSPDSTNEDGLTALHQCCIDDSEDMMKLLIDFGANVNARDTEQWSPLHAAATCGHLHLVKYLIAKGADLLAVNADGNMPYDICEDESTLDFIESEMAKRGITQEMIDETRAITENQMLSDLKILAESSRPDSLEFKDAISGATPLHIAAANGYLSVVDFLLDHHVSTDALDNDEWQAVHAAACWGHVSFTTLIKYYIHSFF